jgi:cytochrome P450
VQRDGDIHGDRLAFNPDRFIGNPKTFSGWIPFGGGRRRCVGSHMALLEMKVVIKTVLDRVDLEPPPPGTSARACTTSRSSRARRATDGPSATRCAGRPAAARSPG